jgi:protein AroM
MIPAIRTFFSSETKIFEKGVLDGKLEDEILQLSPEPGESTLISRLRNGKSAIMAKERIIPLIQQIIDELNQDKLSLIILACTGSFPMFQSSIPVIYLDYLLNNTVKGLFRGGKLGVNVPLQNQAETIKDKWEKGGFESFVECSSPYLFKQEEIIQATLQLDKHQIKAIILDCMGYTEEMKNIVKAHTLKPVILSRNMIYKVAAEIIN